jgi:phage FluMu gp28-like protein
MMKIYIGGRISGMSYEDCSRYFNDTKETLQNMGYFVYSPMTAKASLRNETVLRATDYKSPVSTNHAIVERDRWCVEQADVFYLNLMATQEDRFVSIGGMMELAWAHQLGRHTVIALPENNVHRHAFVLEAADVVFTNHEQCMVYLNHLIKQDG